MKRRYWLCGVLFLLLIGGMIYRTQFVIWDLPVKPNPDVAFEWLIEPIYEDGLSFQDGVVWVVTGKNKEGYPESWDLIDQKKNVLKKDFAVRVIMPSTEGRAYFVSDPLDVRRIVGFVDISGDCWIPDFEPVGFFSSGLVAVSKNGLYGFVDRDGQPVIPLQYEWASGFVGNMGGVAKGGKYGFINKKGETVVDFIFDIPAGDALPFYPEHNLQAVKIGNRRGLLNDKGEWVAQPEYERLYVGRDPLIGLQKDGRVGFVNLSGDIVVDFQFMGIPVESKSDGLGVGSLGYCYRFSEGRAIILLPPGLFDSFWYAGYGVIDEKGKLLFTFTANPYGVYSEGFLVAQKHIKKEAGLIDRDGNWIPLPEEVYFRFPDRVAEIENGILRATKSLNKENDEFKTGYLRVIQKDMR